MKQERVTAAELTRALEGAPEYQERREAIEQRLAAFIAKFADEELAIANEMAGLGYKIRSVWDFVNNTPHPFLERQFVGPYELAYPILAKHLSVPHHQRVREGIIRALTVRDGGPLVVSSLLREFPAESDPELQWLLANALRVAMPLKERKRMPEIERVYKAYGRSA